MKCYSFLTFSQSPLLDLVLQVPTISDPVVHQLFQHQNCLEQCQMLWTWFKHLQVTVDIQYWTVYRKIHQLILFSSENNSYLRKYRNSSYSTNLRVWEYFNDITLPDDQNFAKILSMLVWIVTPETWIKTFRTSSHYIWLSFVQWQLLFWSWIVFAIFIYELKS